MFSSSDKRKAIVGHVGEASSSQSGEAKSSSTDIQAEREDKEIVEESRLEGDGGELGVNVTFLSELSLRR
ncbi:hypothetical protein SUGI_1095740 [Cryptomeria japonica]|nr:hypothetical protein SUGI_1095740 [Cryptomeria japonica]